MSGQVDRRIWQTILIVSLIHIGSVLFFRFGLPDFAPRKSEITIELGAAPGGGGAGARQAIAPRTPPVKATQSKEQDELSTKRAAPTQQTTQPTPSAPNQTADSAAGAPSTDADYKAAYLNNPKPPYPPMAFQLRIEGTVRLKALVLPDGSCGEVLLAQSSGNELLDQSAMNTVAKWKFVPAKSQGKDVSQWVSIPIKFSVKRL
jgi:protein TonB